MRGELNIQPDEVLDAKGLSCPMPSVKTSLKLEKMKSGEVVEVLTTDMASIRDLPAWAKGTGNKCLKVETDDKGVNHFFIEKAS